MSKLTVAASVWMALHFNFLNWISLFWRECSTGAIQPTDSEIHNNEAIGQIEWWRNDFIAVYAICYQSGKHVSRIKLYRYAQNLHVCVCVSNACTCFELLVAINWVNQRLECMRKAACFNVNEKWLQPFTFVTPKLQVGESVISKQIYLSKITLLRSQVFIALSIILVIASITSSRKASFILSLYRHNQRLSSTLVNLHMLISIMKFPFYWAIY